MPRDRHRTVPFAGYFTSPIFRTLATVFASIVASAFVVRFFSNTILGYVTMVILIFFLAFLLALQTGSKVLAGECFVVLFITASVFFALGRDSTTPAPDIVYFLLDSTEQPSTESYAAVRTYIQLAAAQVPAKAKVGFRIYGGADHDSRTCNISQPPRAPSSLSASQATLEMLLSSLQPQGHSSLAFALNDAIGDLQDIDGRKKIIAIVSRPDPQCDSRDDTLVKEIGDRLIQAANKRGTIEVVIISIAELQASECRTLEAYAHSLHGQHFNQPNLGLLSQLTRGVSSYGLSYFARPSSSIPTTCP